MTIHVVGAGLAGLSAALTLAHGGRGADVVLHEATAQPGGRCRSWHEPQLGATIDNGTHVVVGANTAVHGYLAALGATDRLHWFTQGIDFLDLADGARWRIASPLDLASLARARGSSAIREAATVMRLAAPLGGETIAARLGARPALAASLWDPLARAVMNAATDRAAAAPFARVLRRTLLRGGGAMRVAAVRHSLGDCFVDPAVAALSAAGVRMRFGARLQAVALDRNRVGSLAFDDAPIAIGAVDRVVLALPPWELGRLVPELAVPCVGSPIVNFHVRLPGTIAPDGPILRGLIGGTAEWILARGAVASATVSAADSLVTRDAASIARSIWPDVAAALDVTGELPASFRVIKERRATPLQDPDFERRRPGVATPYVNLAIAGDWVEPGLPCTIEAAIASGTKAAARVRSEA